MSAQDLLPIVVYASSWWASWWACWRKRWWLMGLIVPIAVVIWPQVEGDPNQSWSGGDFSYQAGAVVFALEMAIGLYLTIVLGFGLRRLVRRTNHREAR